MSRKRYYTFWVICTGLGLATASAAKNNGQFVHVFRQRPAASEGAANADPANPGVAQTSASVRVPLIEAFAKLPLHFEPNRGQTDKSVQFLAHGQGYTLFLTGTESVISFADRRGSPCGAVPNPQKVQASAPAAQAATAGDPCREVFRLGLVGANPAPKVEGGEPLPGTTNYFTGRDPHQWLTKIPNFARVRYQDAYPGVDLVYYGNQGGLEFDFVVAPGADPKTLRLNLEGGGAPKLDAQGDLLLAMSGREIRFHKPRLYQLAANGKQEEVSGQYVLMASRQVGFQVAPYDRSRPLVIDPFLTYSTYLGGASYDQANGIAIDAAGNAYVTGFTQSNPFPTTAGAFQTAYLDNSDAFVTKLSANGSTLLYSTYLSGDAVDQALAIAVDSAGSAYIAGQTFQATTFPITAGAYQTNYQGFGDVYVAKLSPDGSALVYSTYLGGGKLDVPRAIAVDSLGNAYVTGKTFSTDFPTLNAFQATNHGQEDAFVAELNPSGSALVYSTYLGGSGFEQGSGIAVDSAGNAYVTGYTSSAGFPVSNAVQPTCGSCSNLNDAFVTEIAAGGGSLVYSTFLGGSANDEGMGIAVDPLENAYVTGFTFSTDFPATSGAYQTTLLGGSSAFVAQIGANGLSLNYSTYLGTDDYTFGEGIAVLNGNAYVAGLTHGNSFPVVNGIQSTRKSYPDAFVAEVNATGSSLYFSTYLGGNLYDEAASIAVDSLGNAYLAGHTQSADFTTANAYQITYGGGDADALVAQIHVSPITLSSLSLTFADQNVGTTSAGQNVTVTNNGSLPLQITGVTVTGLNGGDFLQTNNCTTTLNAAQTCTVTVTFSPSAAGTRTATVNVAAANSGSPPQIVSLTGSGITSVGLAPAALVFGNQQVGTPSAPQAVTLSNYSTTPVNITSLLITGTNFGDFGQTSNCGPSLDAGANCTINVTFTPTAAGARSATLTVGSSDPLTPILSAALSGTGTAPVAGVSPTSLAFGNQLLNTTSTAKTVTLSNAGTAVLSITSIGLIGANAGNFAQSNACGTSLAIGAHCTISVTFKPTATGARTASLTISGNDPVNPMVSVSLSGTGTAPVAVVAPTALTFGNQLVNTTSAAKSATLSNTGTAPLTITGITLAGTNAGDFARTTSCGTSLAVNSNCTISVTFKPTAAGARSASLNITGSDPVNPTVTVTLSGTGTAPIAGVSPTSLAFGNQLLNTTSAAQTVTLSNTGTAALTISSITDTGTNSSNFAETTTCGSSLAAGSSCLISVTFKPSALGARSATLSISSSDPVHPTLSVPLSGTGATPVASVSPATLTFSSPLHVASAVQAVTVSNTGGWPLTISIIGITGTNSGDFAQVNTCGSSVAAGANCTISVTFTPTAVGARSATLAVTDNASGSPQKVTLKGTGIGPVVSLSSTSLSFGKVTVNTTSSAKTVTLKNTGTATLNVASIGITGTNSGDFTQTNNCGSSVAVGASCTISVTFKPQATGSRTAAVAITDNASGSPQQVSLSGTGR